MFPFGNLNCRIIWVGANDHVLRSAAKKDRGVLTLNSARCSFKAPEFLPFLCKAFGILHSSKVSSAMSVLAMSVFQPNRSQSAVWKSWCWEPRHCKMCILWAYITASQPGLGEHHVSSWSKFLISFLAKETRLSTVRALCSTKQLLSMGMRRGFSSRAPSW